MLQDYLVRDPSALEELEFDEKDLQALRANRDSRAVQTVLKFCIARMIKAENDLFDSPERPDEAAIEGLIQARAAYRQVAYLILTDVEDEKDE